MITINEALQSVLSQRQSYGTEKVKLSGATGRFLAEDIFTDLDAPPFDRVMMDGVAIRLGDLDNPIKPSYIIQGIQAAGTPQMELLDADHCLEVMTGAILPIGADTIIPYEEIETTDGNAHIQLEKAAKRFVHYRGSDSKKGQKIIPKGKLITAADIGILATVGKADVSVAKLPSVAIISTGDELVEVDQTPLPHQIRKSNVYTLWSAIVKEGILSKMYHINDDKDALVKTLSDLMDAYDVLLLSGGVSKGKFDHIPDVLSDLGVHKLFHRVAQRPGKPFWFGHHPEKGTKVFAYPGNPVSTYVNHLFYFQQWLHASLGTPLQPEVKTLGEKIPGNPNLSRFVSVSIDAKTGRAYPFSHNGSGDLFSLSKTDGFLLLPQRDGDFLEGEQLEFLCIR
ncbi:molybdopterin molybdenumtransferase MoeA [Echinicola strongylocentroti]|uniref:Molybdopterin molybdenumtransferase n=1 Tax=Echinicola strongylocentroti TaxID=1795355 RepID=A0A2Z4IL01_9BACT|nr:molybdopterin molybdotransferase MoeA [Echinicola strongylocentroti]AWW31400.1 molybdopterin molybdenumtransferase MoeA [Echinicola strongylocentroti]